MNDIQKLQKSITRSRAKRFTSLSKNKDYAKYRKN